MNTHYVKPKFAVLLALYFICIGYTLTAQSQIPLVTVRFANPTYSITNNQYCVDVEFKADTTAVQIFGMNIRFFYDDSFLDLVGFSDFKGGYGIVAPSPPEIITSPAGPLIFNFTGAADFVNGAMQLVNQDSTPIVLSTVIWTKIFQVCFVVVDPDPEMQNFCPSLIWDLEQDPENGGYLVGDDGVVITCLDPDPELESRVSIENVVQFNWVYIGSGSYPYGEPVSTVCIPLNSPLVIIPPQNVTIEFGESIDPGNTGFANASDLCDGDPIISFSDTNISGSCPGSYEIHRTWIATNYCDNPVTGMQILYIVDTTAPLLSGVPEDTKIICEQLPIAPSINAKDLSQPVTIAYMEYIKDGDGAGEYNVLRQWICTDACGNSTVADQHIYWIPNAVLTAEIVLPLVIDCNSNKVIISSVVTGELAGVVYNWEVSGGKSYIQSGEGSPQIYIHVGQSETFVKLTLTDAHGCTTIRTTQFNCGYSGHVKKRSSAVTPDLTDLKLWPNPASETLNLGFESTGDHKIQIAIVNSLGQIYWNEIINTHEGYNAQNIDISEMAEGNYLIRVKSDKVTYTKTLVILNK